MLHSVYDQPDAGAVQAQFERLLDDTTDKLPEVTQHFHAARADILTLHTVPRRDLAADLVEQPHRTVKPGDPAPHRQRHDLPQQGRHCPARRRCPGQTDR